MTASFCVSGPRKNSKHAAQHTNPKIGLERSLDLTGRQRPIAVP